ncbi:hypothetical protein B0O80DRAFT_89336 [Mortierella sp. GBAus27b]|nr:hypothetical protein B0O80DRAFT_89336 [Mortierella sp. GBAus27b]
MFSRTAFICALAAALTITLLSTMAEAHSWADCVDWRFKDSKKQSYADGAGRCHGWARRFPVNSKYKFGQLDDASPNRHYDQGPINRGNPACSDRKRGAEKGSDETRATSSNPAYGGKWGTQAVATPGQKMCVRWPAKTHAGESGLQPVFINMQKQSTKSDPSQKDLNDSKKTYITKLKYQNCNGKINGDFTPCGGCWTVPSDAKAGTYLVQWRWKLNSDEFYTSCWDLRVDGKKSSGK